MRLTVKGGTQRIDTLHHDQLGSVIGISNPSGQSAETRAYHPFGKVAVSTITDLTLTAEDKGFIGERYDADAGLQYLNARYFDPELGMFIQPDWLAVTDAGVGTNRYAYANNDPVNKFYPNGNFFGTFIAAFLGAVLAGTEAGIVLAGLAKVSAIMGGFQTANVLAYGADTGQVIASFVINFAASQAGAFLGGQFVGAKGLNGDLANNGMGGGAGGEVVSQNLDGSISTGPGAGNPSGGGLIESISLGVKFGARLIGGTIGLSVTPSTMGDGTLKQPLYHRLDTSGVGERALVAKTKLVYGRAARMSAGGGVEVRAYPGPAPVGNPLAYTFTTPLQPLVKYGFIGGQTIPRQVIWTEAQGAFWVDHKTLAIPAELVP